MGGIQECIVRPIFLLELREAKVPKFINLTQRHMSMREYFLKFTKISNYAPYMVVNLRARMSKFISGVSNLVSKACKSTFVVKEIEISHLMSYAKQIKEEKLREQARESKRTRVDGGGCSHQKSGGHNKF